MKTKWLISTCWRTGRVAPATKQRAALYSYRGVFVSADFDQPGRPWEKVKVDFWATARNGRARMLYALGMGPLEAAALLTEMLKVNP